MLHNEKQKVCDSERLCDGCSELATFDTQHNIQVLSPELSEIRCSLATNINHRHDPFIHRLPFELASKVFVFHVEDFIDEPLSDQINTSLHKAALISPLLLGRVCRTWRDIAWAIPQLWSTMTLLVRNVTQLYTLARIDLINQWLNRSGQQPLNITIQFQFLPEQLQGVNDAISSLFDPIRDHSYHWRRIHLIVPPNHLGGLLGGLDSLPLLEHLAIHPSVKPMRHLGLDFQLVHTPLLARVEFADLFLRNISLDWTNLTFVSFTCVYIDEIFHILQLAPKLTGANFVRMSNESGDFPDPTEIFTHQALRTLHIQPEDHHFSVDLDPFFSKVAFPSLIDFTYDSSVSDDWFPLNGLLDLFNQSQSSLTHLTLVIHESGAMMREQDLTLLLQALPTITHLSLTNFDTKISLITDHFFLDCAETPHRNADVFLPHLQVLKYEGWRSFEWKKLADMCYSRSTPRTTGIDDGSQNFPVRFHFVEFELYPPLHGDVWDIEPDCIPLFKQARELGTTISVHCKIYHQNLHDWEIVDLLPFT